MTLEVVCEYWVDQGFENSQESIEEYLQVFSEYFRILLVLRISHTYQNAVKTVWESFTRLGLTG